MEHELSAFLGNDITQWRGTGLAILTPAWMEHILNDDTLPMFDETRLKEPEKCLGTFRVMMTMHLHGNKAGIDFLALKKFFFETMGIPANLRAKFLRNHKTRRQEKPLKKKTDDGWLEEGLRQGSVEFLRGSTTGIVCTA